MRTIDELKNEIQELENVRAGILTEVQVLDVQVRNANAKVGRISAKIEILNWALNEDNK